MATYHGYSGDQPRGAVVALGNFDGVHDGHRRVIAQAGRLAETLGAPLGVALFEPHPRRFFQPDAPPFRLMSAARRDALLAGLGVDRVHALPFDAAMAAMSPETFVDTVLHQGLGVSGVVTGADFRFGAKRAGDVPTLIALGQARDIAVEAADLRAEGEEKLSSSLIRDAIRAGDMPAAARLLGAPWTIEAEVIRGDQRGRTIGFPTANMDLGDFVRPAYGVYALRVGLPGEQPARPAVANFGKRPTVDGETERLEVHLLDFEGDLYGQILSVAFEEHLRGERKFDGLDALKAQIAADSDQARALLTSPTGPA
jgi:riboflavin kinase/FMN adenylyltransferase